ncbi:hypothetical protein F443_02779 [Phytophthora nicotianae P1569]|uniref:Integrase catalytic domain-containing protein n=1 Tax=Phytophthora nicotianae P1569 TaxID=1317065 RepID=V9FSG5_PHYNI|nr:hypothetical protein F443_02779 [Phytophthora nicotianae P1569]
MNDASMPNASVTSLEHASFSHLSMIEWETLHRLAAVSSDGVITTLLTVSTEGQQRLAAQEFMARELADLRQQVSTPAQIKNKTNIVKLDVSTYSGEGESRLHLKRWFCEVDIAIEARQLSTELARTCFLLSKLTGKAKDWALGKLVADASCFLTTDSMKMDLRLAIRAATRRDRPENSFSVPAPRGNLTARCRPRLTHEFHDTRNGGHLGCDLRVPFSRLLLAAYIQVGAKVGTLVRCVPPREAVSIQAVDLSLSPPTRGHPKMVHLAPVAASITAQQAAALFVDVVYRHHCIPSSIVSDWDPRFTSAFWRELFKLLGTRLAMSTASHPETDGLTERANRVVEDVLRSFATSFTSWTSFLSMVEFANNNAVHSSTGLTPFFINFGRHPRVPVLLGMEHPSIAPVPASKTRQFVKVLTTLLRHYYTLSPRDMVPRLPRKDVTPSSASYATPSQRRWTVKKNMLIDAAARTERCSLSATASYSRRPGIQPTAATNLGTSKLAPRFVLGDAYTLQLPTAIRLHPTFYVDRLHRYHPADVPSGAVPSQHPSPDHVHSAPVHAPPTVDSAPPDHAPVAPAAPRPGSVDAPPPLPPSGRTVRFLRDGPPPLVDSAGHVRHIVEAFLEHDDRRAGPRRTQSGRGARIRGYRVPSHRQYLVRWIGPLEDSWEAGEALLQDVPDCVAAYEASVLGGAAARRA